MSAPEKNPAQDLLDQALVAAINRAGNSLEAVKEALRNGASPDVRMGEKHGTAMAYLAQRTWHDRKDYIAALLEAKADPNLADDEGRTPLHLVAQSSTGGSDEVMALLIANKASLDARDRQGMTPLHTAVAAWLSSNSPLLMMQLLDSGADTEARDNAGRTPLGIALTARQSSPAGQKSATALFDAIAAKKRAQQQAIRDTDSARQEELRLQRKKRPGLDLKK